MPQRFKTLCEFTRAAKRGSPPVNFLARKLHNRIGAATRGCGAGIGDNAMASPARRPTILIVLHQEHSTPGRVGFALRAMGARLDIRRPSLDEPLPRALSDHDGVVVFGGPMGATDSSDWIRREFDWLETTLPEDSPLPGIRLGPQMMATPLGARPVHHHAHPSEIAH